MEETLMSPSKPDRRRRLIQCTLLIGVFAYSCSPPPEKSTVESRNERIAGELSEFSARAKAVANWMEDIPGVKGRNPFQITFDNYAGNAIYQADLQKAIVRDEPIAFVASVSDVSFIGDEWRLVATFPDDLFASIVFSLSADRQVLKDILEQRPARYADVLIAARVFEVRRPVFSYGCAGFGPDDCAIEVHITESPFLAQGDLISAKVISNH
jgi:hypothetical protein